MVVTSLDNNKVKKYRKLQKRKYREQYGEYIVEGLHLILEAFKAGVLEELILEEGMEVPVACPYTYFSSEVMSKISMMDTPSTIMGVCRKVEDDAVVGNRILILDGIQDPGNLGTIIRSAVAFDVDTIVLSERTVDLYNPKVLRATQGMFFHVRVVSKLALEVISMLQNLDIPVYGTSVVNGVDVRSLADSEKKNFALVVGNEGNGVRDEILAVCNKNLYIGMNKNVESLNVAIAASILLYELGR